MSMAKDRNGMTCMVTISPHDPLVVRDGRPFGDDGSNRARALDWPYPSVAAGGVRSLVGRHLEMSRRSPAGDSVAGDKRSRSTFSVETIGKLQSQVEVAGPLPLVSQVAGAGAAGVPQATDTDGAAELYLPVPADVLAFEVSESSAEPSPEMSPGTSLGTSPEKFPGTVRESSTQPLPGAARETSAESSNDNSDDKGTRQLRLLTYEPLRPEPLAANEGCNLPGEGLWPVWLLSGRNSKPAPKEAFWPLSTLAEWLATDWAANADGETRSAGSRATGGSHAVQLHDGAASVARSFRPKGAIRRVPKEERVHVQIDPRTGRAMEGMLFSVEGLVLPGVAVPPRESPAGGKRPGMPAWRAAVRVRTEDPEIAPVLADLNELAPWGGERRIAQFRNVGLRGAELGSWWSCPARVRTALADAKVKGIRLVLATPAIFEGGWRPGWIDPQTGRGCPPGLEKSGQPQITLRLRAAAIDRWRAVSGWSLDPRQFGPKPSRRLVPAGGVYFFEVEAGDPRVLADLWLESVADNEQDRRDGFGLALWGVWQLPPSGTDRPSSR